MAKYKIIPSSRTIVQSPISIGHKAEKGVEAIEFDVTAWVETYGSGTLTVIMRRWGDAIPYPIALEIDENNKATWTLSDIDTAKAGMAYAQLSYIVGETVVKKSDIYTFRVMDSLTGEGEPPEAYESWLEQLTHLAAEAMAEVLDIEGIVTDKTLTVDGGIADAKTTGDALALKADKSTTYTKTEVDQMIKDVEVETDTTLAISGAPADAKKVGDELGAINESLGNVQADLWAVGDSLQLKIDPDSIGLERITYNDGYIRTANTTVDISTVYESTTVEYAIVPVSEGDVAVVNGEGYTTWKAWCFIDENSNNLKYSISNLKCNNLVLTAPQNAAYLILNRYKGDIKNSYKGAYVPYQISSNSERIFADIKNNILTSRCTPSLDYDGRIDADGITVKVSNTQTQRYSDYIPINAGELIIIEYCVPYIEGRTTWLAYSVYDSNKDVIIGRRHTYSNILRNGMLYAKVEYSPTVDGYIRIMGDTYGVATFVCYDSSWADAFQLAFIITREQAIKEAVDKANTSVNNLVNGKANTSDVYTKTEVNNLVNGKANTSDVYTKTEVNNLVNGKANTSDVYTKTEVNNLVNGVETTVSTQITDVVGDCLENTSRCTPSLDYDGRIDADGITIYNSATVEGIPYLQRYSDYIPVKAGENLVMVLRVPYVEGRTTWLAYSVYDSNKDVVIGRRHTNANTTSNGYMYSTQTYTPTVDGYIRVTGNTYGEGIFAVYVSGDTDSAQIPRQKIKKEIVNVSVEKAVKEAIPLMQYYTRYDDVCIGVNHRGYNTAPENTIPAYIESYKHGFRYVECDVKLTSDGEFVLLHDATINRTARNADGTAISETTNITDITYEQASGYDFGIYKSSEYAGTKIPLLSEFLLFCRKVGLHPYLELKFAYTEAATKAVVDMVRAYGMSGKVTYISGLGGFLRTINAYEPTARLGIVTELPTSEAVNLAVELKNDSNFVFIDADRATDEAVNICKQSNIPMEVWIVTAGKNVILSTNPYVTGFSHDYLHAGKVMYENAMGEG